MRVRGIARDGRDLRVRGRADDEQMPARFLGLPGDNVDLLDEGACRVHELCPARGERLLLADRNAVRADDDGLAGLRILGAGDLTQAHGLEALDDVAVVDDWPERHGRRAGLRGLLRQAHGPLHAEAEARRLS